MKKIFKWVLQAEDRQVLQMPAGATLLSLQVQKEQVCLWALCDPEAELEDRVFIVHGTGFQTPEDPGTYVGTALLYDGGLVLHFFEPRSQET